MRVCRRCRKHGASVSRRDEEKRTRFGLPFATIDEASQVALLQAMELELEGASWRGMPLKLFFSQRYCTTYAARTTHPHAWS
jgi:hypothetical protein